MEYENTFRDLYRPVFLILHVLGTYTGGGFIQEEHDARTRLERMQINLHKIYCFCTNLLTLSICLIYLYELSLLSSLSLNWLNIFAIVSLSVICLVCSSTTTLNLRNRRLQKLLLSFENPALKYNENFGTLPRRCKKVYVISGILVMLVTSSIIALILSWSDISEVMFVSMLPNWLNYSMLIVITCLCFLGVVCIFWFFHIGSAIIGYEFQRVNCGIRKFMTSIAKKSKQDQKDVVNDDQFARLYEQHGDVVTLMEDFNGCVSNFLIFSFFASIPLACALFYMLLTNIDSSVHSFTVAMMLLPCVLPSTYFSLKGSWLNAKAHGCLQDLFNIHLASVSERTARQVSMLMTRVTGTSLGLNVLDMFTITPQTSFTIAGTLITYFIVVVQFTPLDHGSCNPQSQQELFTNLTERVLTKL